MPTYEYRCEKCGKPFEAVQQMSDPRLDTCDDAECGGKADFVEAGLFTLEGEVSDASTASTEGELLDVPARAAYRERLAELRDDLAEAERHNDAGRMERARSEIGFLERELSAAVGLGGRARRTAGPEERARKAVYNRIQHILRNLQKVHPELADHLGETIQTGTSCLYRPRSAPDWLLDRSQATRG